MWKNICVVALAGASASITANGLPDGHRQIGNPFRFDKISFTPSFSEVASTGHQHLSRYSPVDSGSISDAKRFTEGQFYTHETFPNPFEQSEKCVSFPNLSHTWLCDPDKIMSADEQKFVETRLMKLRDSTQSDCSGSGGFYQAAVAVASDIAVKDGETPQDATDKFAESLLKHWAVGNKGCHDGIVLAFVKNLNTVSLATRENVHSGVANPTFKKHIEHSVNKVFLSTGSSAAAVATGVELLTRHLPQPRTGMSWTSTVFLAFGGMYLASVVGVYYSINTFMSKKCMVDV